MHLTTEPHANQPDPGEGGTLGFHGSRAQQRTKGMKQRKQAPRASKEISSAGIIETHPATGRIPARREPRWRRRRGLTKRRDYYITVGRDARAQPNERRVPGSGAGECRGRRGGQRRGGITAGGGERWTRNQWGKRRRGPGVFIRLLLPFILVLFIVFVWTTRKRSLLGFGGSGRGPARQPSPNSKAGVLFAFPALHLTWSPIRAFALRLLAFSQVDLFVLNNTLSRIVRLVMRRFKRHFFFRRSTTENTRDTKGGVRSLALFLFCYEGV